MKLVECVPNFSEGRNMDIINAIAEAIKSVEGVKLLDVDPGADTNRTVVTFIGSPDAVVEGAFQGIKKASHLIDMSKHKGAHARMGATDVCPFVPVSEVTMDECAELARILGKRVGEELGIPVYLYENAATRPSRRNLADIRAGEYEALPDKFKDPDFIPDFGEPVFNARAGATVIGAREFLIAYNINLNTDSTKHAKKIANRIREKGTWKRDENNKILRDEKGEKVREPGLFKECKATGWYIDEYKQAQITMNLTNYKISPVHLVFDKCCELAHEMGLRVTGSELVGLIPKEALLMAGRYYLNKQGGCEGIPEEDLIRIASLSMGLSDISEFDPKKKIIESFVEDSPDSQLNLTLSGYVDEVSRNSPAPGGGAVSALCGSLSAGLSAMVANLTYGKKGYTKFDSKMNELAVRGQIIKKRFLDAIIRDTDAFNLVMAAMKMKKGTEEEETLRNNAIEEANKKAALVPLEILEMTHEALDLARMAGEMGNKNALSDSAVSSITALAAGRGAWFNVMINLGGITDEKFKNEISLRAEKALEKTEEMAEKVQKMVRESLGLIPAGC